MLNFVKNIFLNKVFFNPIRELFVKKIVLTCEDLFTKITHC